MELDLTDLESNLAPKRGRGNKSAMTDEQRQKHSDQVADRQRDATTKHNEVGSLPDPVNPREKEACRLDLERYLWFYLRVWFTERFGKQQKKYITTLEDVLINGGTHAQAMSRGWGKTRISAGASMWAGKYRHRKFNLIIGATDELSQRFLTHIKGQCNKNDVMLADFPEVFIPIRKLKNVSNACLRQTYNDAPTDIEWTKSSITFPTIEGSLASGYHIDTAGLTGAIRGLSFAGPGGTDVRPDFILLDDPQTKESARSVTQTQDRIDLIDEDVMGLGGPNVSLAVIMPCTKIRKNDLADQFLDRKKRPYWRGLSSGVFDKLPDNLVLWGQYNDVRAEAVAQDLGLGPGNKFYEDHREEMDLGCTSNWPEMFDSKTELSAIQRGMNKYFEVGRRAFMAEYMNDPEAVDLSELYTLDPETVRSRLSRLEHFKVPLGHEKITIAIDVQENLLWYVVTAWKDDFTGSVIDYGWCPDQDGRRHFDLENLSKTLHQKAKCVEADTDAAVSWGLEQIGKNVLDRAYVREDGIQLKICRGLIDINDHDTEPAVARFCRLSKWASVLTPARGWSLKKTHRRRISKWTPKPGERFPRPAERAECEWMCTAAKSHLLSECMFDVNHWRGRMNKAFSLPQNASGSLTVYGEAPSEHRLFSEHVTGHYPVPTKYDDVEFTAWTIRPGVSRVDLMDCLVSSAVAASIEGVRLGTEKQIAAATTRRTFSLPGGRR